MSESNPALASNADAATEKSAVNAGPDERVSLPALEKELSTSPQGLSSDDASARLQQYGYNELPEKTVNPLLKFLSYFWGPIPWMIEVAAVLSLVVRHWSDFGIILTLLVVNAVVGFWEEFQAGNTIAALKKTLAAAARVRRDGRWINVPARELVPGDVIRLRLGDIVPADARLLDESTVDVDQSALTGESLPATRAQGQTIYSGSIIRQGEADALVYATGRQTFFGKTAALVEQAETVSHFQQAILKIGNYLILIAVVLVVIIFVVATVRGDPWLQTLQFALVLTVAAIPVAMPTVLSVTMAVGARFLAKQKAVVSHLPAVEELAGMDLLCSDKTGTLTQNRLTPGEPYVVTGIAPDELILAGALASRAEDQDAIDLAVLKAVKDPDKLSSYRTTGFQPFDPVHKRTQATVVAPDGSTRNVTKGAPQVILALSQNKEQIQAEAQQAIEDFARRGFRSLGVAQTDPSGSWRFLGIIPLHDPVREDSKQTLRAAEDLGVRVKMVTGDQLAIAREIARELELGQNILDARILSDASAENDPQVEQQIEQADGFAQVFPEHKYHIVEVLQKHQHITGMTGDGVNDAPALKKADVGIAVSGATDAARSAADIVLLAPGLSVIVRAIRQSREIFERMNSYATYRIAETLRVLLFMTLSILIFNFYPVTAVMIVLLALLNDGAILSIAYDRVVPNPKPQAWDMRSVLGIATVLGVMGVVASFLLFFVAKRVFQLDRDHIQTLMYLKLSVAGHLTIFVTRTRRPFFSTMPAPILLIAVIGTQVIATLIAVYGILMTPIGWGWAGFVWGFAIFSFLLGDVSKLVAVKFLGRRHASAMAP